VVVYAIISVQFQSENVPTTNEFWYNFWGWNCAVSSLADTVVFYWAGTTYSNTQTP